MADGALAAGVLRNLSDRQYERRKLAAAEIESRVRELAAGDGHDDEVDRILRCLGRDFAQSNQANNRKGGLIGLAAAALGLGSEAHRWLHQLLPPLLRCFTDQDARVRYYACESLYNVAKVCRTRLLAYFNQIFGALARISADLDPGVKNGAQLLDSLLKDIVADSSNFPIDNFMPILRQHLESSSSCLRHLLIGWIVALDAIAHVGMQAHLKQVLPGVFAMLSDEDPEIRQQADHILAHFLQQLQSGPAKDQRDVIEVVVACGYAAHDNSERSEVARVQAMQWIVALIKSAGNRVVLSYSGHIVGLLLVAANHQHTDATMQACNEMEDALRELLQDSQAGPGAAPAQAEAPARAEQQVASCATLVEGQADDGGGRVDVAQVVECILASLRVPLLPSEHNESALDGARGQTATSLKALKWLDIVMDLIQAADAEVLPKVAPVCLLAIMDQEPCLSKPAIKVLSKIALKSSDLSVGINGAGQGGDTDSMRAGSTAPGSLLPEILARMLEFLSDRSDVLDERGGAIIKELCVLLGSETVFLHLAAALEGGNGRAGTGQRCDEAAATSCDEAADAARRLYHGMHALVDKMTMVLLTVTEVADLRAKLMEHQSHSSPSSPAISHPLLHPPADRAAADDGASLFAGASQEDAASARSRARLLESTQQSLLHNSGRSLFEALYTAWRPFPASALCLCLLAGEYQRSAELVSCIALLLRQLPAERTLAILVQLDKLVQLLESPAFASLRLQLLSPHQHPYLIKSLYGILMLLPQRWRPPPITVGVVFPGLAARAIASRRRVSLIRRFAPALPHPTPLTLAPARARTWHRRLSSIATGVAARRSKCCGSGSRACR